MVYGGNSAVYTYSGGIRFSQSKPLRGRTTHIYYIYVCINDTQRILFLYFFPSFFRFIDLCNFFPVFCSTKMLDVYTRARTHTHTWKTFRTYRHVWRRTDRPTSLLDERMEEEQRAHNCRSSTVGRYAVVDRRDASDHHTHFSSNDDIRLKTIFYYNTSMLFVLYASPRCIICILNIVWLYNIYIYVWRLQFS